MGVWGYGNDLAVLYSRASAAKTSWSPRFVPWGRRILMLEAVCELCVICSHMANLPEGTNFLGNSNRAVMWCSFLLVECAGTCAAIRSAAASVKSKDTHSD